MANDLIKRPLVKYQVFISSPFSLREVRQTVVNAVWTAGHIPIRMEITPAESEETCEVIKSAIEISDIYILILGHKYGSRMTEESGQESSIGYTEWEYQKAIESGAQVLVFLLREDEVKHKRQALDASTEGDERRNEELFWNFYSKLSGGKKHFAHHWSDADPGSLSATVVAAVMKASKKFEDSGSDRGLISASNADDISVATRIIRNELRKDIHRKFNDFIELDDRCVEQKESKKALARTFVQFYSRYLAERDINLFFDTGSTAAYVAKEYGEFLRNEGASRQDYSAGTISVATNCALTFLHLWLSSEIPCSRFPFGPVEAPYGASHGPISLYGRESSDREADYDREGLSENEKLRIEKLHNKTNNFGLYNDNETLIIGGVSGLKLDDDVELARISDEYGRDKRAEAAIRRYRGFHVGDYHSMLFKRFLLSTKRPQIICIHQKKFSQKIVMGKCHLVFDKEYAWEAFLHDNPFGLCIGFHQNEEGNVLSNIERLGLTVFVKPKADGRKHKGILAVNKSFSRRLKL